jgi:hypothetical protein
MWIDTEIKGQFTTAKGIDMISFVAKREADGRNWAAPLWLVSKGLGAPVQVGLAVRIEINGDRISRVQRHRHQSTGAATASDPTPSPGTMRPPPAPAGGQQPGLRTILPYGFVPIDLKHAVQDAPVCHDGSSGGELLSGEILCELEALTPLLPGNQRYKAEEARSQDLQSWGFGDVAPKKQIAEPLRLPDGRVVIAGSAIKGMIRHSIGALTSAPMERVAEHHFTYRPNLDFNRFGTREKYVVRPALVVSAKHGGWEVEVFADARDAIFVRSDAEQSVRNASSNGVITGQIRGITREMSHLIRSGASEILDHRLATYKGGIDGEGLLAAAFQKRDDETLNGRRVCKKRDPQFCRGPFTYDLALVPKKSVCTLDIAQPLYQRYLADQKQVLANHTSGHLTAHPLEVDVQRVAANIEQHSEFSPGQLIYVEITTDASGKVTKLSQVVSCGHHFRYRWAYTSSVRKKAGQPRACLTPMDGERNTSANGAQPDIPPQQLTGARLLFGYVRDDQTNPIGKGVFERMAGRIAFNHAVSVGVPDFLGTPDNGYCVPLKILGQPKPSAWEFYLQQPEAVNQPLVTYGDLPGDPGGDLAGRKFYRHQTRVSETDIKATDHDDIKSDQATLARFICATKTRFRFAIRFTHLREWELGALLAVLEPHLLKKDGKAEHYAHKLGLGRPLGMGSVRVTRKGIRLRQDDSVVYLDPADGEQRITETLKSLGQKLGPGNADKWLAAHEVSGQVRLAYPVAQTTVNHQSVQTIYAWHTNLRRAYSKLRREEETDWSHVARNVRRAKSG